MVSLGMRSEVVYKHVATANQVQNVLNSFSTRIKSYKAYLAQMGEQPYVLDFEAPGTQDRSFFTTSMYPDS